MDLIRPEDWAAAQGAQVGGTIKLELPEFSADGSAEVTALEPCPAIDSGQEAVVTGLFRHEVKSGEILELQTSDSSRVVRVTPTHRYWSADRPDFVEAGELRIGEHLSTVTGTATVVSLTRHPYSGVVFNLETTEHVYRVGDGGVLVHNGCAPNESPTQLAQRLGREGEQKANILKNTTRIDSISGKVAYRTPDEMTLRTLTEVKNVKYQHLVLSFKIHSISQS